MKQQKILVSRTDRAGDLILTLPVFREIKKEYPNCHLTAHVRRYTAPITKLCSEIDDLIIDDDYEDGLVSKPLIRAFRERDFDRAIIVHPTGRTILSAFCAKIPIRTGRASNIYQFFLNDKRRQNRSKNEKHEFEYNLDLLEGFVKNIDYLPISFKLNDKQLEEGKNFLIKAGMGNVKPVIIHPGHGGSAYNIAPNMYAALAERLLDNNIPVLVSLGPGEEHMEKYFGKSINGKLGFISGIPDLEKLATVFACCRGFIGGSTGPLHLAASLGLKCVAYFPPVKAMTPKRWGPVGCDSLIIKPSVNDCYGKCDKCNLKSCMNLLTNYNEAVNFIISEK